MSRFISNKVKKIMLSETEFVEIREALGYEQLEPITRLQKEGKSDVEFMIPLLAGAIVSWNFVDDENNPVPVSSETIKQLDFKTLIELTEKISEQYFPGKKESGLLNG